MIDKWNSVFRKCSQSVLSRRDGNRLGTRSRSVAGGQAKPCSQRLPKVCRRDVMGTGWEQPPGCLGLNCRSMKSNDRQIKSNDRQIKSNDRQMGWVTGTVVVSSQAKSPQKGGYARLLSTVDLRDSEPAC